MEYLEVQVDKGRFAIPATAVLEVLRAAALATVANSEVWDGVLNLRGEPVPILNLRVLLGFPARPLHPSQYFVILEHEGERFGVRADSVDALAGVTPSAEGAEQLRARCPYAERYLIAGDAVVPLLSVVALRDALAKEQALLRQMPDDAVASLHVPQTHEGRVDGKEEQAGGGHR